VTGPEFLSQGSLTTKARGLWPLNSLFKYISVTLPTKLEQLRDCHFQWIRRPSPVTLGTRLNCHRTPQLLPLKWNKGSSMISGSESPQKINKYRSADKSLARPGRKKAMFLSEWREFPSAPCLAGKRTWQLVSRFCWNCACPWHASELVSFLGGLRTYQHPGVYLHIYIYTHTHITTQVCVINVFLQYYLQWNLRNMCVCIDTHTHIYIYIYIYIYIHTHTNTYIFLKFHCK